METVLERPNDINVECRELRRVITGRIDKAVIVDNADELCEIRLPEIALGEGPRWRRRKTWPMRIIGRDDDMLGQTLLDLFA